MEPFMIYCSAVSVRLSNFNFNTNSPKKETTSSYASVEDASSYIVRKQSGTIQNHGNIMVKLISKDGAGRESQTTCSTKLRL